MSGVPHVPSPAIATDEEPRDPRFASRGRAYVYVLPCRDEDLLKVGFSRDPAARLRTLHRRFFEFFDLERGLLVATDHVRDARRIERRFIEAFRACGAPAPPVVRSAAGGHTEWFRGVGAQATDLARTVCEEQGFTLLAPLRGWLRERLAESAGSLYDWSARMLDAIEFETHNVPPEQRAHAHERALRDVLDAHCALGLEPAPLVPESVACWHAAHSAWRGG